MSASKYFVWSGSRWRELDTEKGTVAGWTRRPRFVFVRRGKLRVAARRRVLSALQALATKCPSAAGLGPRLSVRSTEPTSPPPAKLKKILGPPALNEHHHCCMHINGYSRASTCFHTTSVTTDPAPSTTTAPLSDITIHHRETADAAVQYTPDEHSLTISLTNNTSTDKQNKHSDGVNKIRAPRLDKLLSKSPRKRKRESSSDHENFQRPLSNVKIDQVKSTAKQYASKQTEKKTIETSKDEICKVLEISETDIAALRTYVARTKKEALKQYDADDGYKRMLFFSINPLVNVERCAKTERALRERHDIVLPHFAARLGLTPQGSVESSPSRRQRIKNNEVQYRERSSSTDKEDKFNKRSNKKHAVSKNKSGKKRDLSGNKSNTDESDSEKFNKHSFHKSTTDKKRSGKIIQSLPQRSVKNTAKDSESESESDSFQKSNKSKLRERNTSNNKTSKQDYSSSGNSSDDDSESNQNNRCSQRKSTAVKLRQINIDSSSDNSISDTDTSTRNVGKLLSKLESHKSKTFKRHEKITRQTKDSDSGDERKKFETKRQSLRKPTLKHNKDKRPKNSDSSDSNESDQETRKSKRDKQKANKQSADESDSSDNFEKKRNKSIESRSPSKKPNEKVALNKPTKNKRQSLRKFTDIQREAGKSETNKKTTEYNRKTVKGNKINFDNDVASKKHEKRIKKSIKTPSNDSESDDNSNINKKTAENNRRTAKENKCNFDKVQKNDKNNKNDFFFKKTIKETQTDSDSDDDQQANKKKSKNVNMNNVEETEDTDSSSDDNNKKSKKNTNIKTTKQTNFNKHTENEDCNKNNNTSKENKRKDNKYKNKPNNIANNQSDSESSSFEKKRSMSTGSPAKTIHSNSTDRPKTSATGSTGSNTKSTSEKSYVFKPTSSSAKPIGSSTNARQSKSKKKEPKDLVSTDMHTISKRPTGHGVKEYSNLEDHAIVAWVSSGGRARKVNGNALWRELQENYNKLTGISRSWHSLRNRYLRYILPSLGALRLPPADVSRLRAAAATGEIKGKRLGLDSRRNSIFKEAEVRGASSRRPRLEIQRGEGTKEKRSGGDSGKEESASSTKRESLRSYFVAPRPYNDIRQSSSAVNSPATPSNKRKRDDSENERVASENRRDGSGKGRDVSENGRDSLRKNRDSIKEDSDSSKKRDDSRKRDSLRNGRDGKRKDETESDEEIAPTRSRRSLTQSSQPVPSTSNSKSRKLFNPKLVI